ncbi:MAG: hypothetical protein V1855_04995 [bacterium]
MKFKKIFILSLFIFCKTLHGEPNYQESFLQANDLYKQKKYEQAFKLYKKIPYPETTINYNLGNCAYKMNKLGYALLYWRRAENDWGLFNREELLANIALVKEQIKKNQGALKLFGASKLIHAIPFVGVLKEKTLSLIRSTPLIWIQLFFLFIWFFLFIYLRYLYQRKLKFIIFLLFLLASWFGLMLVIKYNMRFRMYGIIVKPQTKLLSGPSESYQTLLTLPEGGEGKIKTMSDNHYKVKINGQIGWINSEAFEKI